MVMKRDRIVQDRVDLCIIIVIMRQHFINVLAHPGNFPAVVFHIVTNDGKCFCKILFFCLFGYSFDFSFPALTHMYAPFSYNDYTKHCIEKRKKMVDFYFILC